MEEGSMACSMSANKPTIYGYAKEDTDDNVEVM